MNIIIDLDQALVVSDFTNRNPVQPILVKSQDTPLFAVYFVYRGVNYDLGASPGIRFGLFQTGNPNPLVACSAFVRGNDNSSRVCYRGYPVFNTVPLAAAVGSSGSVQCLGEFRYQTSGGTIVRTQDVNFTVQRVLLSETILDNTTAAFTTPAVGSNVPIAIGTTTWLQPGLIVSIGAGAGNYTVVSITDATHFVAQNNGGTGNASPGTNIPTGTTVGIAPATVISTYPDPSVIEITTHKGAANGYAGLDANRFVLSTAIPVDGQTISALPNGKIGVSAIITYTTANFTTPGPNATVSVTLSSTSGLRAGQYVRIPIAGYYIVQTITDGTHAVLQNNADPFNAAGGATITTGATLLPAQAAAGGGGGSPGQNAFTTTTASFIVPAIGGTVTVAMGATSWLGGSGYVVFIQNAGYYAVSSILDAFHAVLTNLGYPATNAASGTTIASGSMVSPGGVKGADSTAVGSNAYDTTTASFVMPAASVAVPVTISNTAWLGVGQEVYIAGAGYFSVQSITSPTVFAATNSNYPGAAAPGSTIAAGAKVSPAGPIGPQGAGGPGLNAFTTLSANFVQPAVNANVTANVGTTAWMAPNQGIFIQGGGYYTVISIADLAHAVVMNLGGAANVAPGATITGTGTQTVSPSGSNGIPGVNAFTVTTAPFTQPTSGSTVTVTVGNTAWMAQGQNLFIPGAGYYSVSTIVDATHVVLINSGTAGNAGAGNTVASGSQVSPAGSIGAAGPIGPTGPTGGIGEAPTDGQTYGRKNSAWTPVTSGAGGPFDPRNGMWFYEDFQWGYSSSPSAALWNGVSTAGGSYSFSSSYGQDTTHKSQGIIELACGTVSGAGGALFNKGYSGLGQPGFVLGLGTFDLVARIAAETSLPASGSGFFIRFGLAFQNQNFGTTYPPGAAFSTVIMEWSPDQNSGLFRLGYSYSTGTITYTNGTSTPVGDTYGWWELNITSGGVLTIYLNGTSCGSVTLPSNVMGVPLLPLVWIGRTSGTTNMTVALDTMFCNYPYTR